MEIGVRKVEIGKIVIRQLRLWIVVLGNEVENCTRNLVQKILMRLSAFAVNIKVENRKQKLEN